MPKLCLECQEELTGRADKKFCDDQCRNNYNNNLRKDYNNLVRKVNNILRKNRRVLGELNPKGKKKVSRQRMIEEGFNFSYFTNIYETKKGDVYYFCYDQGYRVMEDESYLLVERGEYV